MSDFSAKLARVGFPLFIFVLTTVYLVAAFHIRVPFDEGLAGPRFLPVVATVIMYLALLRILWRESRRLESPEPLSTLRAPAQVVAATALYGGLFQPLGYPFATFLLALGLFWVFRFESGRPIRMAAYAAAVTLVFYLLFGIAFNIRLPMLPGGV